MKRWGFHGGNASHGASLSHRIPGSTGARQNPGKVWKGKKMAGRMGGKKRTQYNLKVFEVHPAKNVLSVVGSIPGANGGWVKIRDSILMQWREPPPFPTYFPKPGVREPAIIRAKFDNPWKKFAPDASEEKLRNWDDPDKDKNVDEETKERLFQAYLKQYDEDLYFVDKDIDVM